MISKKKQTCRGLTETKSKQGCGDEASLKPGDGDQVGMQFEGKEVVQFEGQKNKIIFQCNGPLTKYSKNIYE